MYVRYGWCVTRRVVCEFVAYMCGVFVCRCGWVARAGSVNSSSSPCVSLVCYLGRVVMVGIISSTGKTTPSKCRAVLAKKRVASCSVVSDRQRPSFYGFDGSFLIVHESFCGGPAKTFVFNLTFFLISKLASDPTSSTPASLGLLPP